MANLANTQDLVTIEDIRESTVVLKYGALRQVLMVGGLNFALKSETEQNIITSSYQNFLNSLIGSLSEIQELLCDCLDLALGQECFHAVSPFIVGVLGANGL